MPSTAYVTGMTVAQFLVPKDTISAGGQNCHVAHVVQFIWGRHGHKRRGVQQEALLDPRGGILLSRALPCLECNRTSQGRVVHCSGIATKPRLVVLHCGCRRHDGDRESRGPP
jgi:hypothetical protein